MSFDLAAAIAEKADLTLEDILEEIVGEFESEHSLDNPHIHPQAGGAMWWKVRHRSAS